MKKTIITLSIALLTLSSCSDFIEEDNRSSAETSEYLKSSGYESLINANYAELKDIYGGEPWLFVSGTDLYAEGRSTEPIGISQYTQLTSSSPNVDYLYKECYKAIQRANTALHFGELTEKTATLSARIGEVKYLRANAYFLLVQTYGGVSLDTQYHDSPVLSFDRNSAEEIYTFIVKELEESLNLVPAGAFTGRVTKRAVQDLLAKVYLTRAYETFGAATDFATAAKYADDAIAGQALTIKYSDLWLPANDINAEVIFSAQFSAGSNSSNPQTTGNGQASYFSSYLGGSEVAGKAPYRSYNLLPTDFAIGLFEKGDTRWDGTFMTQTYTRYYDYYDVANKTGLAVTHFYVPKWMTPAELDAYKLANPKTNIHLYGTYGAGKGLNSDYQTIPVRKFDDPKAPFATSSTTPRTSTRDFVISRLADTYLIAAEAYLRTNPATGLIRLNEVRKRAGVANATAGEFNIDYILDERAREMIGEYNRWFDLKRTGKLIERASLHNFNIKAANFDGANGEKKILRPIPQEALDLNQSKNFPQNPAYN
ncbi:RagB/SusD family nutrient uptake outer membrane protein [Flavobacterium sp. Fl-318]|uniref:RagB/SusD family nutrient uptake outer membrane protein n=1 Tax=Flavobacterium cupriresistens TaxID=2893885 RepID=A0ABU4RGS7_9FLAO|nr:MULTISPECIES: RagB/SusD family nutrient uptake outer membrane protein [unclassified Flavobacterium]MDX6191780.1 RagB/SusD family nutrient uptake outer membrane protein [Flavobacterium sp. Fl-318]UFH41723.1 RagB/SusD family nutrient uptake outer membrane protein [Flavobacterium sp. F-323]